MGPCFDANLAAMRLHAYAARPIDAQPERYVDVTGHFDRCPDDLSPSETQDTFCRFA